MDAITKKALDIIRTNKGLKSDIIEVLQNGGKHADTYTLVTHAITEHIKALNDVLDHADLTVIAANLIESGGGVKLPYMTLSDVVRLSAEGKHIVF